MLDRNPKHVRFLGLTVPLILVRTFNVSDGMRVTGRNVAHRISRLCMNLRVQFGSLRTSWAVSSNVFIKADGASI